VERLYYRHPQRHGKYSYRSKRSLESVTPLGGDAGGVEPGVATGADSAHPRTSQSFTSQVVSTTAANLLIGVLGLTTGIILARLLGANGRGELAAIQTWPLCIATLATLGLPEALVYFGARQPAAASIYLSSGAIIAFLGSLVLSVLGYFALPTLLAEQSSTTIDFARAYLPIVTLYPLFTLAISTFRRAEHLRLWNVLRIAPTAGWLILLIGAFFVGIRHAGYLAVGYLLLLLLLLLLAVYLLGRFIGGTFRPSLTAGREMLGFSLPTLFSVIPQLMNTRLDQLIIAGFLPAKSLGLYVVAVAWSSIPSPLLYGLGTVLFPHIAQLRERDAQKAAFAAGSRVGMTLCGLSLIVLAIATPWLLPVLFGAEFSAAVSVALVLIAAGSLSAFNLILEEGLRGLGHPKAVMRAEIGGMIVMAISLFTLLPSFELLGAGLACLFGYAVVSCLLLWQARGLTGMKFQDLLRPRLAEIAGALKKIMGLLRPGKTR
jgi:O-antigen/teichoic acid export membrane protein